MTTPHTPFEPPRFPGLNPGSVYFGSWVNVTVCSECLYVVAVIEPSKSKDKLSSRWSWLSPERNPPRNCGGCGLLLYVYDAELDGKSMGVWRVDLASARFHDRRVWYNPWTWLGDHGYWEIRPADLDCITREPEPSERPEPVLRIVPDPEEGEGT